MGRNTQLDTSWPVNDADLSLVPCWHSPFFLSSLSLYLSCPPLPPSSLSSFFHTITAKLSSLKGIYDLQSLKYLLSGFYRKGVPTSALQRHQRMIIDRGIGSSELVPVLPNISGPQVRHSIFLKPKHAVY